MLNGLYSKELVTGHREGEHTVIVILHREVIQRGELIESREIIEGCRLHYSQNRWIFLDHPRGVKECITTYSSW